MPSYVVPLAGFALVLLAGLVSVLQLSAVSEVSQGPFPFSQFKIIADDASPIWDIAPLLDVLMQVEDTVHYQLNTPNAAAEWAALIPANGGIVHVGPNRQPFMPSIFHQLRCLDILRKAHVEDNRGEGKLGRLSRHCLNYLRQMAMCRANVRLEAVVDADTEPVQFRGNLTCRDWRSVYKAAAGNDVEFSQWRNSQRRGADIVA